MRGDSLWNDVGCNGAAAFVCANCPYLRPNPTSFQIGDGSLSMAAAEIACTRVGGHLASIHSDADNAAIMDIGGADKYIGFHDMFTEVGCAGDGNSTDDHAKGFIWTDGTFVDYTNWNNGDPND